MTYNEIINLGLKLGLEEIELYSENVEGNKSLMVSFQTIIQAIHLVCQLGVNIIIKCVMFILKL